MNTSDLPSQLTTGPRAVIDRLRRSAASPRVANGIGWALTLLVLATVAHLALALTAFYFGDWIDSDYLYPHVFAVDVLRGQYPLSGWTLSSAPYFFPDLAVYTTLLATQPDGSHAFDLYVVFYYVALALGMGWSAGRILGLRGTNPTPWLVNALALGLILAQYEAADTSRYLWWLGTPGFHGGAVLLGLVLWGIWCQPSGRTPGRAGLTASWFVLTAGILSDTLLLTQFVVPLLATMWLDTAGDAGRGRFRALLRQVLVAWVIQAAAKVTLSWLGLHFSRVLRYLPLPQDVAGAFRQFATDLTSTLLPNAPGIAAVAAAGLCWLGVNLVRRSRAAGPDRNLDRLVAFSVLCVLTLPIAATYWRNSQHARYLLPLAVLPAWWMACALVYRTRKAPGPGLLVGAGAAAAVLLTVATGAETARPAWPYPAVVRELDGFLASRGLHRGLCDYWDAHMLNQLSREGLSVTALAPDARQKFWNNNALHHFEVGPQGTLQTPGSYRFVITDRIDEAALRVRFGPPTEVVQLEHARVWLYDEAPGEAMRQAIQDEISKRLGRVRGVPFEQR